VAEARGVPEPGEIERRVRVMVARAINEENREVFRQSQNEVPIDADSPSSGALSDSGHISKEADPYSLTAEIRYGTPYGAAQHEGEADMVRNGRVIHWVVRHHTMPGRKTHYLSDPLKARAPFLRRNVEKIVKLGLKELERRHG
jgi:hypothetical protein